MTTTLTVQFLLINHILLIDHIILLLERREEKRTSQQGPRHGRVEEASGLAHSEQPEHLYNGRTRPAS